MVALSAGTVDAAACTAGGIYSGATAYSPSGPPLHLAAGVCSPTQESGVGFGTLTRDAGPLTHLSSEGQQTTPLERGTRERGHRRRRGQRAPPKEVRRAPARGSACGGPSRQMLQPPQAPPQMGHAALCTNIAVCTFSSGGQLVSVWGGTVWTTAVRQAAGRRSAE